MHECKFCDRTFVGARALRKHQLEHEKSPPRIVPNIPELWAIIQQLAKNDLKIKKNMKILVKKNKLYEEKIEDLMKRLKKSENNIAKLRKKGKFNIIDWLNTNYIEDIKDFIDWKKSLIVTVEHIEYLFENKYVKGVINILKENLEDVYSIRSFKEGTKKNMYIFDNNKWKLMKDKDFMGLIANIHSKIAGAFLRWQKDNQDIVNNTKNGRYERYMIEAFGGKRAKEVTDSEINKKLFKIIEIKDTEL